MSAYKNFIEDFPGRCMEVLQIVEKEIQFNKREVTLSLMVASAGFVIPFERLKPPEKLPHPSRDRKNFPKHANSLKELMKEYFLGSKLHPEKGSTWLSGNLKSVIADPDSWDNPDSWPELNKNKIMTKDKSVKNVLKKLRNALAHGNIYTKGEPKIESIIFVSIDKDDEDKTKEASFVSASPSEFLSFLKRWFQFLSEHKISIMDANKFLDPVA